MPLVARISSSHLPKGSMVLLGRGAAHEVLQQELLAAAGTVDVHRYSVSKR